MEITVSQEQGRVPVTVLHIKGDLSTDTADQLLAQARQAYQAGTLNLLMDLAEVPYISSYGIRALSDMYKMLRTEPPAGGGMASKSPHLKLANPSPPVLKVLQTTGLDLVLEIYPDLMEAIASF